MFNKSIRKISAYFIFAIILVGCSKDGNTNQQKVNEQGQQTEIQKTDEMKRIDEQSALINLLVTNNDNLLQTQLKIEKLPSLATTEEGKRYANDKKKELVAIIKPKIKEILESNWTKYYSERAMEEEIPNAVKFAYRNSTHTYTILSVNFLKDQVKLIKNGRAKTYTREYLVMTREHTGIFSSDNFYTMNVVCKAYCSTLGEDSEEVDYRADVTKVVKTQKPQTSNNEWK